MNLVILPQAREELEDAASFYRLCANVELARAFLAEFERAIGVIRQNPRLGSFFRGKRQRFLLRRFPYSVIYQVTASELRVVAVAHQRRRPGYWSRRK